MFSPLINRCVNPTTPVRTTATVATSMLNASSLVTLATRCTSVSAVLVMLEMASSVERTLIWMDGPTRILRVEQMPPTIAKRYYITHDYPVSCMGPDVHFIAKMYRAFKYIEDSMLSDEFNANNKADCALIQCFLFNLMQARP